MIPTIEQILSAAHEEDDAPMTLRRLREEIDAVAADLVDDDVPVLVRVRSVDGTVTIGTLEALTTCHGGGVIAEATVIESRN